LQEYRGLVEEMGMGVEIGEGDSLEFGRLDIRSEEITVVQPLLERVDTDFTMMSDYRQAVVMLRYSKARIEDPMTPFMTDVPPYQPAVDGRRIITDEIRKVNKEVCQLLNLDPSVEDDYLKFLPHNPGRPKFSGFVNELEDQKEIHWRFNPYSPMGAKMVQYIRQEGDYIVGCYMFKEKTYRFSYRMADNPYYIIHSDVWYARMHGEGAVMTAFSLAAPYPFWPFNSTKRRPEMLPVSFKLVSLKATLKLPPYDISRGEGREMPSSKASDDIAYMSYGSSYVYTFRPRSYVRLGTKIDIQWIKEMKVQKVTTFKLCFVNNEGTYERRDNYKACSGEIVYFRVPDYSIEAVKIVGEMDGRDHVYYAHSEANLFRRGDEYIYVFDKFRPYLLTCMSVMIPIVGSYMNKSGNSVVESGCTLSQWIHLNNNMKDTTRVKLHRMQFGMTNLFNFDVRLDGVDPV